MKLKKTGITCKSNAKAWMVSSISEECLVAFDEKYEHRGKKVIIFFFITSYAMLTKRSVKEKKYSGQTRTFRPWHYSKLQNGIPLFHLTGSCTSNILFFMCFRIGKNIMVLHAVFWYNVVFVKCENAINNEMF